MLCKKIILIGNGQSVCDKRLGPIIDSFETVVRFNNFQIEDFEEFTGRKTTIWVRNDNLESVPDRNGKFKEVLLSCNPVRVGSTPSHTAVIKNYHAEYERWLSTGMMAILHFVENNDFPIFLHGFDFFGRRIHHYFPTDIPRSKYHSGKFERAEVRKLIAQEKVKILKDHLVMLL